jgi:hypothetical protein
MDFHQDLKKKFSSLDNLKIDTINDDTILYSSDNKVLYCSYKDLDYNAFTIYKDQKIENDINAYLDNPKGDYPFNRSSPHFNIFGDWNKQSNNIIKEATDNKKK